MKKLILAMALFCTLLLPCFSQKEIDKILNIARRNGFNAICALEFPIHFGINTYWLIVCESFYEEEKDIFILDINHDETINIISNDCYVETQIKNNILFPYEESILKKQIKRFQVMQTSGFIYDFTHDGNYKFFSFATGGSGIHFSMEDFTVDKYLFFVIHPFPLNFSPMEFINYRNRQGIKFFTYYNKWQFFYYDRIQQKYVQDENASSEELEQIHGSPDFFAEAGIDYAKLERPLVPSDLEGFSKAALRIWRNAVYARHGRTFKSEDLQALFNEYAWYKPDNEYTDDKLTDIDRANIKLIQEIEKK